MLNSNLKIMRALIFLMGVTLKRLEKKMSVDFSKLNSSISQLSSEEPVHNTKNFFGGALIVRDLHAQGPFPGDATDEEARGNIGGNAQLAGLEDNVALAAGFLQVALGAIEMQT